LAVSHSDSYAPNRADNNFARARNTTGASKPRARLRKQLYVKSKGREDDPGPDQEEMFLQEKFFEAHSF
jgi:hypothetical protein